MQFERFFFLSQLILVLIYISPNEAISKNIYTDIEKPDTTLSATPYWKVVEAEYGEKKCEYIGGKIIHEYKDVFVVFRIGKTILLQLTKGKGRLRWRTRRKENLIL